MSAVESDPFVPSRAAAIEPHTPLLPPLPPEPTTPDAAPAKKRATTRAGRAAAAERAKLEKSTKKDSTPKTAKATPRRASLETRLTGSLVTLGTMTAAAGGMVNEAFTADGILIVEHAESIAKALDKVAKDQPHVAAALERMLTAGVYSGLIAAMLPVVIGIAANHGALPQSVAGLLGAASDVAHPDHDTHGAPAGG